MALTVSCTENTAEDAAIPLQDEGQVAEEATSPVAENQTVSAPVYSVAKYGPERDAEEDLTMTVRQATQDGKRILLQVGGDWCGWCLTMNAYFHENANVAQALSRDFIIMKVNYSDENQNKKFFKAYPEVRGYPHIFVLDSDGKLLHSQGTGVLEKGGSYSEEALLKFLSKWAPEQSS